jgi:beta-mannosidase
LTRKIFSLNDANWRVGSVTQKSASDVNDLVEVRDWIPAQVPGDVRLDLLRAHKIPDPFVATNNEDSQWVDSLDWWYVHELNLDLKEDERAFLVLEGVDYQSAVFASRALLGRHVGMFSRQIYELPRNSVRTSQIALRVSGSDALPKMSLSPKQKIWRQIVKVLFRLPNEPFPDRYATLKCQMQFGWDFAPRLRTCGIWDDAFVVIARSVFIEDMWVRSLSERIEIILTLDSDGEQLVGVDCDVRGSNFSTDTQSFSFDLELRSGKQVCRLALGLQNAREWNPWDRGDPNLYEMDIKIKNESNQQLDSLSTTFGIRSVEFRRDENQQEPWTVIINRNREFIRGANWVPLDAIPGRLKSADYAARLKQARDANVNLLRVWGGGLREKRAFYDLCDELGFLVWQEFPFAGAILDRFPRDGKFLKFVDEECTAIVRKLRNHPALVVWCGGNEFNTRGNRAIVETLKNVVNHEDGTRPFKPASPHRDESHNWRVWHHNANVRDYKNEKSPFLSEFGLQSVPKIESLEKFIPHNALFPPNALWEYHHSELKKMNRYADARKLPSDDSANELIEFVNATQRAQANALQIAIEHMRRRKAEQSAGVAVWQFNDCWPSISWSVVDYYGLPKLAFYALKRAYAPVLASFDYPFEPRQAGARVRGGLWIINDLRSSFTNAQVTASLNGKEIYSQSVNIAPDSAELVSALDALLTRGENILRLKLSWGPAPLSENEYDLDYYDKGEINPLVSIYVDLGNRLMR